MPDFAILHRDAVVPCTSCRATWDLELLMIEFGRKRLRAHGFKVLWFEDDHCISVINCPHCELPFATRELMPAVTDWGVDDHVSDTTAHRVHFAATLPPVP